MDSIEKIISDKSAPVIEKALQRTLGVTIKELSDDITQKLKKNPLLEFNINTNIPLRLAKKSFRKGYLEKALKSHFGDISSVARILEVDRKTVHRMVSELRIDISDCRRAFVTEDYVKEEAVGKAVTDVLKHYEHILHPSKVSEAYANASRISEEIVKGLNFSFISLKDAEKEFEREYISAALKENDNSLPRTAKKIGLSHEALYRKVKSLHL